MNTRDTMHDPERPPLSAAARAVMSPRGQQLYDEIQTSVARARERKAKEAPMTDTQDDLQAAIDKAKGARAPGAAPWDQEAATNLPITPSPTSNPDTTLQQSPAPKAARAPRAFFRYSLAWEEDLTRGFGAEAEKFLHAPGIEAYPCIVALVAELQAKVAPLFKTEEVLHLNDHVYYMNSKKRSGKLIDITSFGDKEYGTVEWDVFTKTPASVVPMANLRKL